MEQVLVFDLAEERYGLEVRHVQEVTEAPSLNYIPRAPDYFIGAMNFHGQILPVLDLGLYLGFGAGPKDQRLIVLAVEGCALALAVTVFHRIVALASDSLLPYHGEPQSASFVRAVFQHGERMINLLDVDRLLLQLEMA